MRLIVTLALIFLLVSTTFIVACTAPPAGDNTPAGVLKSYCQALNDRDTRAVHDSLSSALRAEYDHQYATTRRDPVYDSLYGLKRGGATIQSIEIMNQTVRGPAAVVEVDYFWHYSGRTQTDERRQVVEFVQEGGEWKLNNFFPFIEPDSTHFL